jgi:hypothetical protein
MPYRDTLYPDKGYEVNDRTWFDGRRVREGDSPWTCVEVTSPDWSQATERARTVLERVTSLVVGIKKALALEVFLRREPDEEELSRIVAAIPGFCSQLGPCQEELPDDLGLLLLNETAPLEVIVDDHGDGPRPRIGMSQAIVGRDEPHRQITVRMAYFDKRAEAFLDSEAGRLPSDTPGLIMILPLAHRVPFGPGSNSCECNLNWSSTDRSAGSAFSRGLVPTPKGKLGCRRRRCF